MADLATQFREVNLIVYFLSVFEEAMSRVRERGIRLSFKAKKTIVSKLTRSPPKYLSDIDRPDRSMVVVVSSEGRLRDHQANLVTVSDGMVKQVVDESLCCIGTRNERRYGVALSHLELASMSDPDGQPMKVIKDWLKFVIQAAPDNLRSSPCSVTDFWKADSASSVSCTSDPDVEGPALLRNPAVGTQPDDRSVISKGETQNISDTSSTKQADPRIPCFGLQTMKRNPNFFGRQDVLASLDQCLLPPRDPVPSSRAGRTRVALLRGIGGLGKTETAVEYAYSRRAEFDAIFLVRAEDKSKLESDLARIAVQLGIQDPQHPDDEAINRELALKWLTKPFKVDYKGGQAVEAPALWLVIFDNANEPDIHVPAYREIASSGSILITSRNPLMKTSFLRGTTEVQLQCFTTEEASDYLRANTDLTADEARQLGYRLGGLPLALVQMAPIIRHRFLSYKMFMAWYDDAEEGRDVHGMVVQPLREPDRGSLSTVWAIDKLSEPARALLEISAFFHHDSIPEVILRHKVAAQVRNLIPEFPRRHGSFLDARQQLISSSLIQHKQELSAYWMHRVTQDVVRGKMSSGRRKQVFSNAVEIVSREWPTSGFRGYEGAPLDTLEKLYPHVVSLGVMHQLYGALCHYDIHLKVARLLYCAGWYKHQRGESPAQLPLLEYALEICTSITAINTTDLQWDIRRLLSTVANKTNDKAAGQRHS
ncbi:hypothetical protein VTJ49DRAFT_2584 [Mycothermus thermophilus]|uniref:DUF7779 domain-containing protein n=1 Tax=Humicola insolens TaxID=85995 RepID=A0ABR3VNK3_HUMIN